MPGIFRRRILLLHLGFLCSHSELGTHMGIETPGLQRYFRETPILSGTPDCSSDKEQELFLEWNVTKIQAWWRSRSCIQRFKLMKQAAETLQANWRSYYKYHTSDTKRTPLRSVLNPSAQRIQRCWRSYKNKKIFKYYRDLITNTEKLHPSLLLRRINPSEASLADSATGLHIRFRLGGTSFPPSLVYKLYTHRPVVDMGALFSPRKYSVSLRRPVKRGPFCPRKCFEHPLIQTKDEYVRCENNGWRLVCDTAWMHNLEDILPDRKEPTKVFHPSPVVRRKCKAMESRRRKRAWLQKIYSEGRMSTLAGAETAEKSDSTGHHDDVMLFLWSLGLNFDSYEADWSNLATNCVIPSYEIHGGEVPYRVKTIC